MGLAVVKPAELEQLITPQLRAAKAHLGQVFGAPVFHLPWRNNQGQVVRRGKVARLGCGTEQRCQFHFLKELDPAIMKRLSAAERQQVEQEVELVRAFNTELEAALKESLELSSTDELQSPVILVTKSGATVRVGSVEADEAQVCDMQAVHCDVRPGREDYKVVITAVHPNTTVVVQAFSHHAILSTSTYSRLLEEDPAAFDSMFGHLCGRFRLVRVELQPGEVLVLHGNTLHAGDRGRQGTVLERIHHYIQDAAAAAAVSDNDGAGSSDDGVNDSTFVVEAEFEGCKKILSVFMSQLSPNQRTATRAAGERETGS